MKQFRTLAAVIVAAALSPLPARAADNGFLSLGAGYTGAFNDDHAADFRAEYRPSDALFSALKPFGGAELTSDGAFYGFGGILWDWTVAPHWYITPSIAAGAYFHGGGKDLGSVLEFRPQIEGAYEFDSGDRLGVGISHTSNFGVANNNPGTEAVMAYYHLPLWRIFGASSP